MNIYIHINTYIYIFIGALERKNWAYTVDEGGGAFYGPKIDIKIQDAIGLYISM
jgi:threonyl-tRNA synthetase